MARPPSPEPTEVELQILQVLWQTPGATAREVHDALQGIKSTTYSTTVKMLTVMREKGMVECDSSVRPQTYVASADRRDTQAHVLGRLIDNLFEGSAKSVVLQALAGREARVEDLAEIRKVLDDLERRAS